MFHFIIDQRGFNRLVRRLGAVGEATPKLIEHAIEQATRIAEADLKRNGMTGIKGNNSFFGVTGAGAPTIGVRSGATRRSVTARTFKVNNVYIGVVGSPAKYLKIIEEGGTIVGSPMLRIPLAAAQTGAGVDRNMGRSVRGVSGFFVWPSRKQREGTLGRIKGTYLAKSAGGRLELWYLLKASVTIKPHRVFEAAAKRANREIHTRFGNLLADVKVRLSA